MPILGRASQARDLSPPDQADIVETDLRDQPLKARPSHGAAGRLAEVIIDHQHAVIQPTERLGTGDEAILEAGGLLMREHLLRARLSHIDDREAVVMPGLELVLSPKGVCRPSLGLRRAGGSGCTHPRPPSVGCRSSAIAAQSTGSATGGVAADWQAGVAPTAGSAPESWAGGIRAGWLVDHTVTPPSYIPAVGRAWRRRTTATSCSSPAIPMIAGSWSLVKHVVSGVVCMADGMRVEELEERADRLGARTDHRGGAGEGVADRHQLRTLGDVAAGSGARTHPKMQADH